MPITSKVQGLEGLQAVWIYRGGGTVWRVAAYEAQPFSPNIEDAKSRMFISTIKSEICGGYRFSTPNGLEALDSVILLSNIYLPQQT